MFDMKISKLELINIIEDEFRNGKFDVDYKIDINSISLFGDMFEYEITAHNAYGTYKFDNLTDIIPDLIKYNCEKIIKVASEKSEDEKITTDKVLGYLKGEYVTSMIKDYISRFVISACNIEKLYDNLDVMVEVPEEVSEEVFKKKF